MKTLNVGAILATAFKFAVPMLIVGYGISRTKQNFKNLLGIKDPTVKELAQDNALANNVDGVPLMSKYLDTDYRASETTLEVWKNAHPLNPKIVGILFDPYRQLRPRFIPWIDVAVVDRQLLKEQGEWIDDKQANNFWQGAETK